MDVVEGGGGGEVGEEVGFEGLGGGCRRCRGVVGGCGWGGGRHFPGVSVCSIVCVYSLIVGGCRRSKEGGKRLEWWW